MLKPIAILVLAASFATPEIPVPVIDLTNTVARNRLREPTTASGSGHSIGYQGGARERLPLALELISAKRSQTGETLILICEVELRNVSKQDFDIPVDPSSRDMESASLTIPYQYQKAFIWLAPEPGAKKTTPTSGLFLYGTRGVPNSLRTLKPGQAVRIRARIPAGNVFQSKPGDNMNQTMAIRAFLALFSESITPQQDGNLHSSVEEVSPTISSSAVVEVPI